MSNTATFFDAVRAGDLETVTRRLDADPEIAHAKDASGLTPIIVASYNGQGSVLALLLSQVADLDVFEAAAVGREPRLRDLLDADGSFANAFAPDGFTPLHLAAFFKQEPAARLLIEHSADVNAVARNGMRVTPLHSAVASGSIGISGALITAGADVNAKQQGGWTPLHAAAQSGDSSLADLLLKSGARKDVTNDEGMTPADTAAAAGHETIAELLRSG